MDTHPRNGPQIVGTSKVGEGPEILLVAAGVLAGSRGISCCSPGESSIVFGTQVFGPSGLVWPCYFINATSVGSG